MNDIAIFKRQPPRPVTIKVAWFTSSNAPGNDLPEWVRSAGVDEDGRVYVPAVLAGGETEVYLSASAAQEPVIIDAGDHLFFRAEWMKRAYPKTARTIKIIERRLKAAQKG